VADGHRSRVVVLVYLSRSAGRDNRVGSWICIGIAIGCIREEGRDFDGQRVARLHPSGCLRVVEQI